jgi:hypothetical protein
MSKGDFPSGWVAVVELEPRSDHSKLSTQGRESIRDYAAGFRVPGRQLNRKESITDDAYFLSQPAATRCGARRNTLCSRLHFDFNDSDTRASREA